MAESTHSDLRSLVGGMFDDVRKLVSQEMMLLRANIFSDLRAQGVRVIEFVQWTLGGLWITLAFGAALREVLGLPIWACFLSIGALSFLVALGLRSRR